MKLTENQVKGVNYLAENINNESDGLSFLNTLIQLREEGVDVYKELEETHGILLEGDDNEND